MARIERVHMEFVAAEDRIRLRVRTNEPSEVRCWLTRRMARRIWDALEQTMAADPDVAAAVSASERNALLARKHARANTGRTAPQEAGAQDAGAPDADTVEPQLPLGDSPLLITRMRIRPTDRGHKLSLLPVDEDERGIHIDMDDVLLHRFVALLARAVQQTDWDLSITPPSLAGSLEDWQPDERLH